MRRILMIVFTAALLCAYAGAARYEDAAKELSTIGIFRGTSEGFDLDRAPTRSEAAIMLTRLYGAEDAAKEAYAAGEIACPFTDVSAFSSPYVAWLYDKGIVNGTSATTFGAANPCTLKNYAAFLLRALGYVDGEDFQYADTLSFARKIGLGNLFIFPVNDKETRAFLRDDLAEMTYEALFTDKKGGETWLLQSLLDSGALDADAAAPLRAKMEQIRASLRGELDGDNPNPWRELSEQEKLVLERGGKLLCDYQFGSDGSVISSFAAYVGEGSGDSIRWLKEYRGNDGVMRKVDNIGNAQAFQKIYGAERADRWLGELVNGDYPRNQNGETYGVEIVSDFVGCAPDLQGAVGANGEHGYIRRSEVPSPKMFEEYATDVAKAFQLYDEWAKANPAPWTINLYDSEGNVIDEFEISPAVTSEDILSEFDTEGMSVEEVKALLGEVMGG